MDNPLKPTELNVFLNFLFPCHLKYIQENSRNHKLIQHDFILPSHY